MPRLVARGVLLIAVIALTTAWCDDTRANRYDSLADALAAGERERGWLPACMPDSATNILLAYNLDTNETWFSFDFGSHDTASYKTCLQATPITQQPVRAPRLQRWPSFLTGTLDPAAFNARGFDTYRAGDVYMAVSWQESRAYSWRFGR